MIKDDKTYAFFVYPHQNPSMPLVLVDVGTVIVASATLHTIVGKEAAIAETLGSIHNIVFGKKQNLLGYAIPIDLPNDMFELWCSKVNATFEIDRHPLDLSCYVSRGDLVVLMAAPWFATFHKLLLLSSDMLMINKRIARVIT